MAKLYWEDFSVGDVLAMGTTLSARGDTALARQYDPSSISIRSRRRLFQGTDRERLAHCRDCYAVTVQLLHPLGEPGSRAENVRWLALVSRRRSPRRVVLSRALRKQAPVGLVSRVEAHNQNGQVVMTFEGWGMFGRRPVAGA
jgi:hypothetical protein